MNYQKAAFTLLIIINLLPACRINLSETPADAAEFTRKYYLYERRADRQFLNQEIEIRGVLSQATRDKEDRLVIILARRNEPYGVKCIFSEKESKQKKPLELSRQVTVKGICKGLDEHVVLTDCRFVY
jgi:hypothetical protein